MCKIDAFWTSGKDVIQGYQLYQPTAFHARSVPVKFVSLAKTIKKKTYKFGIWH